MAGHRHAGHSFSCLDQAQLPLLAPAATGPSRRPQQSPQELQLPERLALGQPSQLLMVCAGRESEVLEEVLLQPIMARAFERGEPCPETSETSRMEEILASLRGPNLAPLVPLCRAVVV